MNKTTQTSEMSEMLSDVTLFRSELVHTGSSAARAMLLATITRSMVISK